MNKLDENQLHEARNNLLEVAKALAAGRGNFIEGIRQIAPLRFLVSSLAHDPDFQIFVAANSESDHLPGVQQRSHCTKAWLEKCDLEAKRLEAFYGDQVRSACSILLVRFSAMTDDLELDDTVLSPTEMQMVEKLSLATLSAIDDMLLRQVSTEWRKMARVVGAAMMSMADRPNGVPDRFFAKRVVMLIQSGQLESQGNLRRMRFCEVRLPQTGLK